MESASPVQVLPYRKNLRRGQGEVINEVINRRTGSLNCQLPTGYGKTFTALAAYSALRALGVVDRLLYIVPSTGQLDQFLTGAREDFLDVVLPKPHDVHDVGYSVAQALKANRNNSAQVFACTIQALACSRATWDGVVALLSEARWMIVVDEYHHYGVEAAWGKKAASLRCVFRLAMSATPYRKGADSAFGAPEITVSYRQAVKEEAVKRLLCHAYVYRIDAVMPDGKIRTYTTEELAEEAGGSTPDAIDRMMIDRAMRWSPKYVSPLIDIPVARMTRERLDSGLPQQVLVGAMCVSHARLVCEQVKAMFPELRVDWVGTGPDGRTDAENEKVLRAFCPPKVDGRRRPEDVKLDILVHVGMAGEGLDSVYVTEVVHLNPASINNTNNQENGRASRVMPDLPALAQCGRVNVDSSSPYAKYAGESIMDVIDDVDADPPDDEGDIDAGDDPTERMLPEEPRIRIFDMECIRVDEGEVKRMGTAYASAAGWNPAVLDDPTHPIHEKAADLYRAFRRKEAEQFNTKAVHEQWRAAVEQARGSVVNKVIKRVVVKGARFPVALVGDIKKKLNQRAARLFGPANETSDIEVLKRHYRWLVEVESEVVGSGLPTWLQ